jgi:hypothetical protein
MSHYKMSRSRSKTQKRQQKNRSRSRRQRGRYSRKSQRGGSTILSPSNYSNQNNAHFGGIGFTDPKGAVTGCTGSTSSAAALKGADIFTTIGGVKTPVTTMKGGRGRRRGRGRMQRGGSVINTNGFSIAGVHLKPSLSGIANNYHTAYDSCKG